MTMRTKPAGTGRCKVTIRGPMTIYEASAQKEGLLATLSAHEDVEVDLSGVTEMDTAGLQILALAKREAVRSSRSLRLVAHSPACLEVLDRYDLAGYFGDPVVLSTGDGEARK